MKRCYYCGLLLGLTVAIQARGDDQPKAEDVKVLKRADLKQFEGVWEMKVDTKKGWKGTVRATITLYDAGTNKENFARIVYDYYLKRGDEQMTLEGAPPVAFAGVRRGKELLLVTTERDGIVPTVPFKVVPKTELSAPVSASEGKLVLDASKSVKYFCRQLQRFELDLAKLTFTKVEKK